VLVVERLVHSVQGVCMRMSPVAMTTKNVHRRGVSGKLCTTGKGTGKKPSLGWAGGDRELGCKCKNLL
jgi:hypothetical protein